MQQTQDSDGPVSRQLEDALVELIELHQDLTTSFVPEVRFPPSPLEFLRQVHTNFPMIYRGAAFEWPAFDPTSGRRWSKQYFLEKLGSATVSVAETPFGNADSPVGEQFVQPFTSTMPFTEFADKLADKDAATVCYMQSQNNNLPREFPQLADDVDSELSWASEAFGAQPEAVNLWIGSSKSATSLHKDPYENLHVQVLGEKIFKLIAPAEYICVKETALRQAEYVKAGDDNDFSVTEDGTTVPWPTMDPDAIDGRDEWQRRCRVLEVVLRPGDVLYLPALWFHKVSQVSDEDGLCCSVNYWYDMEFTGPLWAMSSFVRQCSRIARAQGGAG
ncbi:phospholipase A2 [Myxozyma melibiosi]|uniref:Phospholipase A2 n=1 Tax=Myxozyma melibiosi TaxID=54550 RepID=A0ABR1F7Y8_9ASCO